MAKVQRKPALSKDQDTFLVMLKGAVEQSIDGIAVLDTNEMVIFTNPAWARMHGYEAGDLLGKHQSIFHTEEQYQKEVVPFGDVVKRKGAHQGEIGHWRKGGAAFPTWTTMTVVKDGQGRFMGFVKTTRDTTEQKRAEEMIQRQAHEILEISTPVMQIWQGILVAPLIGTLDSRRTQQLTELLLNRIVETGSSVAILDITGVPAIDTQTARHLIETISAIRLLGAQTVLTGIRPSIAQTLVQLGIDIPEVTTLSSMSAGLRVALEVVGLRIGSAS